MFTQMEEMDRIGYDHIWVTEHHFALYGGTCRIRRRSCRRLRGQQSEYVSALRSMFCRLHNPIDVAESYAMVDVISNGRLDFGVGKGSEPHEYKKFRVESKGSDRAACMRASRSFAGLVR